MLNKYDLVDIIASEGYTKKDAILMIECVCDAITKVIADGNDVTIVGFGTFSTKQYPARAYRNPKTHERTLAAPVKVPSFSAGARLKRAAREGYVRQE